MKQEELELIKLTSELWNKYVKLPTQHPCDQEEFCHALHICQHLIMIRDMRREMPQLFPMYDENGNELKPEEVLAQNIGEKVAEELGKKLNVSTQSVTVERNKDND